MSEVNTDDAYITHLENVIANQAVDVSRLSFNVKYLTNEIEKEQEMALHKKKTMKKKMTGKSSHKKKSAKKK